MALTQVTGPYPIFTDLDGTPLDDGYLYIGEINEDPQTNPIQVFWDSALTIVATQPIRTSNGYAYRNGSPALLYTAGEFSITIRNKRQEFVLYSPVGYGFDPAAVSASVVKNDFVGDGVEVDFTLSASPSTKLATSVFINGVYQEKDSYSIVGNALTFTIAPPLNSSIEVMTNETGVIGSTNASLVSYTAGFTGAVAQTVQTKLEQTASVMDFGAVNDGVTDNTAVILSAAIGSGQKVLIVPPNVKYDRVSLLSNATFPTDVVLFDLSEINDFNAVGETTKHVGIVSKDAAQNDTHWAIDSGHHAITTLNNFGTAGSLSASERKASVLWAAGQYALGAADKRGFRGAAILQFTQDTASPYWVYTLRSLAPWVSIDGEYEEWTAGRVISGTTYVISNGNQYVSASIGTTGGTAPNWTSGTSSDGGVSWTWIDSGDRSIFGVDQFGRWLIGQGSYTAQWRHKVSPTSPTGSYTFEGVSTGTDKIAQLRLIPTNSSGVETDQPFLRAEDGVGLRVMTGNASTDIARFSDSGGTTLKEVTSIFVTNSSTGATPSVTGIGTLLINNGGATNITGLLNGSDGQILQLVFQNANTTMVSSATLLMAGSVNVTPTAWSVITMLKIPSATSDRWVELSRSIK